MASAADLRPQQLDTQLTTPFPECLFYYAAFPEPKKVLHQHQQVHDQEDAVDPCLAGTRCLPEFDSLTQNSHIFLQ